MEIELIIKIVLLILAVLPVIIYFVRLIWLIVFRTILRLSRSYHTDFFEYPFVNGLSFYFHRFMEVPCVCRIDNIDLAKVNDFMKENYNDEVIDCHESCFYDKETESQWFNAALFILEEKVILELHDTTAKVMYQNDNFDYADKLIKEIGGLTLKEKAADAEINIIKFTRGSLELSRININPTTLDIGLFYNDDFIEIDAHIRNKLNQQNDKGIVLLHGLPGTGKTSYLRHLICGLNKRVLFVSPSVAGSLMDPLFIDLLIDNPNSVLIIEDAEKIMMDRKLNGNSAVSGLLNLSDGLLSDCLSVQIVCTFNSSLNLVDSALMRKGRMIAIYEFDKLIPQKAQQLSKHLGFDTIINEPMTLAEVANQHEINYQASKAKVVGFSRNGGT